MPLEQELSHHQDPHFAMQDPPPPPPWIEEDTETISDERYDENYYENYDEKYDEKYDEGYDENYDEDYDEKYGVEEDVEDIFDPEDPFLTLSTSTSSRTPNNSVRSSLASHSSSSSTPPSVMSDYHKMTPEERIYITASFIHAKQEEKLWTTGAAGEGVFLKHAKGEYVVCPRTLKTDGSGTYEVVERLNAKSAITVKTKVIDMLLSDQDIPFVQIHEDLRLQVLPHLSAIPFCQKNQGAAFIMDGRMLMVWEDQPHKLVERATMINDALFNMVCRFQLLNLNLGSKDAVDSLDNWEGLPEQTIPTEKRSTVMWQPFFTAATLILALGAMGGGYREITIELSTDGEMTRLLFILCLFPQLWLGLFFFQAMVGNFAQIIGCVGHMRCNTKVYSGKAPARICPSELPHVTIQMPIFKESLKAVIAPTLRSLKEAVATYEMQGGTANIFVNDDGMQIISDEDAKERQDWFDENNIGWVARPPHNPDGELEDQPIFTRAGKFKKASNMNFGLQKSMQVEQGMIEAQNAHYEEGLEWGQEEEAEAYKLELEDLNDRYGAWAAGNIRIGDYILLVDSDTRVPTDCLLEAVSEMEQCPDVAILQFSSGVMNVTSSFFERGITFFTNLVYTQIKFAVSNGDVAPFVGHNAFLRWRAMQEVAYTEEQDFLLPKEDDNGELIMTDAIDEDTNQPIIDEETGEPYQEPIFEWQKKPIQKYWADTTVSEDFDMALRLQTNGYIVRLAAYQGDGFKEGVSLSVYDELNRWEKYAYGCSELIFHPFKHWLTKGPITGLFLRFLCSGIPLPSKLTILAYIGTYYAIGSAWLLTLFNYFLIGWYNGRIDHYYIDSFKVYFSIICVFTGLGNIALAMMRYRNNQGSLMHNIGENFKWVPLLAVFLGGISLHVSRALVWHMLDLKMQWGTTAKEMEHIPFFDEIPIVLSRFKGTFIFCITLVIMMLVCAFGLPDVWQITFFTPIYPLAIMVLSHFLAPIVLNPNLMRFTW